MKVAFFLENYVFLHQTNIAVAIASGTSIDTFSSLKHVFLLRLVQPAPRHSAVRRRLSEVVQARAEGGPEIWPRRPWPRDCFPPCGGAHKADLSTPVR